MKTLKEYLFEGIFDTDTDVVPYLYHPKNIKELKNCIEEIIKDHKYDKIIDLNCIDTSQITDMCMLFNSKYFVNYNFDVSKWDVKNVKDMAYMFSNYKNFNCDLSKWDVSKVENMAYMFSDCHNFNCDISKWDVSNVENMNGMFEYCESFNSDLSNWDVRKVKDMAYMFQNCKNFNSDLSNWDVRKVKSISGIFENCPLKRNAKLQPKFE